MRWQGREGSKNVDDRRGRRIKQGAAGVGIGTIIMALLFMLLGEDPQKVISQAQQGQTQPPKLLNPVVKMTN